MYMYIYIYIHIVHIFEVPCGSILRRSLCTDRVIDPPFGTCNMCCSVLQYVAVCCSVSHIVPHSEPALQCAAGYCSMLQCLRYSPHTRHLQHTVHCAAVCRVWSHIRHLQYVLQRVTVCCSALQCVIRVQHMLQHVTYGPHTGPLQYVLHCVAVS